jgi:general secretion pathway protein H
MMLISAPGIFKPGIPKPGRQSGFTLLELLITLVVMSIAISLVMVNIMPDSRAQLRDEAERLALLLENAGLEARISGKALAWSSTTSGFRFWRRNDYNDWVHIDENSPFRARELPEGMTIAEVRVEEQPLKGDDLLVFSASVSPQPYDIRLNFAAHSLFISARSNGDISIQNILPPPSGSSHAQP